MRRSSNYKTVRFGNNQAMRIGIIMPSRQKSQSTKVMDFTKCK
ncbi:MAG TPA: hypothetical protein PKW30_03905 [Campylobacterales bacterium]|nr:hypothetical protein [Campylobacterales bacterium]